VVWAESADSTSRSRSGQAAPAFQRLRHGGIQYSQQCTMCSATSAGGLLRYRAYEMHVRLGWPICQCRAARRACHTCCEALPQLSASAARIARSVLYMSQQNSSCGLKELMPATIPRVLRGLKPTAGMVVLACRESARNHGPAQHRGHDPGRLCLCELLLEGLDERVEARSVWLRSAYAQLQLQCSQHQAHSPRVRVAGRDLPGSPGSDQLRAADPTPRDTITCTRQYSAQDSGMVRSGSITTLSMIVCACSISLRS